MKKSLTTLVAVVVGSCFALLSAHALPPSPTGWTDPPQGSPRPEELAALAARNEATIRSYRAKAKYFAAQAVQARTDYLRLYARGDLQAASAVSNRWDLLYTRTRINVFLAQREELRSMVGVAPSEAQEDIQRALAAMDVALSESLAIEASWLSRPH